MHTRRFGPWIVLFFTFCFARFVYADSAVESEYELKLPRGFLQRIIDKTWTSLQSEIFALQVPIPDQTLKASDTDVLLSGIQLDFQTQLQKPAVPLPGPNLVLESKNLGAHLKISSLSVDQWIVREIGGVVGRFHLQAKCENLQLELKPGQGQFRMQLSPVHEGARVRSHLDDMTLAWTQTAWQLQGLNCTGAKGFEDIIAEHVLNLTKSSEVMTAHKAELMGYVQSYLDTKTIDLSSPRVASFGRPDIAYGMSLTGLSGDTQNLVARGIFTVRFKNIRSGREVLKLSKNSQTASGTSAQLRVPEKLLAVLIKNAFLPGTWRDRVGSGEVPGFLSLMQNNFVKCLLWPELKHFDEKDRFAFDLGTRKEVTVTGSGLRYNVATTLDVRMLVPKEQNGTQRLVPFMIFQIPLKSNVELSLKKGVLSALFTNVGAGLVPEWDANYVATYRPNQNFYGEPLRERFLKEAEGKRINFRVPRFQLVGDIGFQIESVSARSAGDLIFLLN